MIVINNRYLPKYKFTAHHKSNLYLSILNVSSIFIPLPDMQPLIVKARFGCLEAIPDLLAYII